MSKGVNVMGNCQKMIETEYMFNKNFRNFVDEYCRENGCTVEKAMSQEEVERAYLYHREV